MKKIKIFLIEDNHLLREGVTTVIQKQPDLKVVASFRDRGNIIQKILELKPDIVLLDIGLISKNSLQLVKLIKKKLSRIKIIVMDLIPTQKDIYEFVGAGVSGFILKDAMISEFLNTIRTVSKGKNVLPGNMTDRLFSQIIEMALNGDKKKAKLVESVRMTKRERQIIDLVADGLTNKEIGQRLNLSPFTVKSHVHNILEKLTLHTRVQIAGYAHKTEGYQEMADSVSLINNYNSI
jgi:DNA-binding NarL/FixJ family response regulator